MLASKGDTGSTGATGAAGSDGDDGTDGLAFSSVSAQSGTTYTLVLGDANTVYVTLNNASAITLTVPPNSSVAFPVGTTLTFEQTGAGQVTVTEGAGVTINQHASETLLLDGQYSVATLVKTATDTWTLTGRLENA